MTDVQDLCHLRPALGMPRQLHGSNFSEAETRQTCFFVVDFSWRLASGSLRVRALRTLRHEYPRDRTSLRRWVRLQYGVRHRRRIVRRQIVSDFASSTSFLFGLSQPKHTTRGISQKPFSLTQHVFLQWKESQLHLVWNFVRTCLRYQGSFLLRSQLCRILCLLGQNVRLSRSLRVKLFFHVFCKVGLVALLPPDGQSPVRTGGKKWPNSPNQGDTSAWPFQVAHRTRVPSPILNLPHHTHTGMFSQWLVV